MDLYRWLLAKHITPHLGGVPIGKVSTRPVLTVAQVFALAERVGRRPVGPCHRARGVIAVVGSP
jgi:hypothetical protein